MLRNPHESVELDLARHLQTEHAVLVSGPVVVMKNSKRWATCFFLVLAACGNVDEPTAPTDAGDEIPCGMRACAAQEVDGEWGPERVDEHLGKADTESVISAFNAAKADGVLTADDIDSMFAETGGRVSRGEILAIRDSLNPEDDSYIVADEAKERALELALVANLPDDEAEQVLSGRSFAGTELPPAVIEMVATARLNGAVAYDVNEIDDDGERVWTPYPATTPAMENMAFDYTEVTPAALTADLEDTDVVYNRIVGTETLTHPQGFDYEAARYEEAVGGTGNVLAHYDEVYHPDIYARGRSGQKWANNVAILSDGTFHCLPASRRSFLQDLILTNPHLSRGKHLLYNGHLDIRDGVVVGIEMSGRPSKLAARGEANFIDPITLLEAWGFEISPNISLRYGNTRHGVPIRENGVVTSAGQ